VWRSSLAVCRAEAGYAMAALLVMMSVMAVTLSVALPVWHTNARREKEAELIFRGEQYARAVVLFQRRYANAVPPNIDVLVNERFLRKRYKDPITGEDFQVVGPGTPLPGVGPDPQAAGDTGGTPGQTQRMQQLMSETAARMQARQQGAGTVAGATPGVLGVVSRSDAQSLRLYNGRDRYNQWVFLATEMSQTPGGAPGAGTPGPEGGRGGLQPGGAPGGGRGGAQPGRGGQPPGGGTAPGGRGGGGFGIGGRGQP
jgi:type II secretory pathway pseudopilin PulG